MAKPKVYRELSTNELEALRVFAAQYGKAWKEKLSYEYWPNARIYRDRAGKQYAQLHALRNDLGPSWLASFKLEV